jgi:hypothetical protein
MGWVYSHNRGEKEYRQNFAKEYLAKRALGRPR